MITVLFSLCAAAFVGFTVTLVEMYVETLSPGVVAGILVFTLHLGDRVQAARKAVRENQERFLEACERFRWAMLSDSPIERIVEQAGKVVTSSQSAAHSDREHEKRIVDLCNDLLKLRPVSRHSAIDEAKVWLRSPK